MTPLAETPAEARDKWIAEANARGQKIAELEFTLAEVMAALQEAKEVIAKLRGTK